MPTTQEVKKPSRKERELEFRLNLVLDAAEEVFAETSFAKASVEEIAERAEISVGTLYNLFRSKEDIYCGVVTRSQNTFFAVANQRINDARGPREQIHASVKACLEHFNNYSRQFRMYVSATNGFQWELKSKLADDALELQREFRQTVEDICQQGMDKGVFKQGIPADMLAMNIIALPHAVLASVMEDETSDIASKIPHALAVVDRMLGTDEGQ